MENKKKKEKIGIWGFGIVGKSALRYFAKKNCSIEVLDARPLKQHEKTELNSLGVPFFGTSELDRFLKRNNSILASPGIDLRPHSQYQHKWITELDIIQKSGAWYAYGDQRLGQGRENAKQFLKEHPEVADAIEQKIREYYKINPVKVPSAPVDEEPVDDLFPLDVE